MIVDGFYTVRVNKVAEGTDRMKEIASYIHEGAMTFLTREYKEMVVFIVILLIILCVNRCMRHRHSKTTRSFTTSQLAGIDFLFWCSGSCRSIWPRSFMWSMVVAMVPIPIYIP